MTREGQLDWLLFGLLGCIWGSSFLFIKIGVETLGSFGLVALRLAFAVPVLALVVAAAREPLPRDRSTLAQLAALALFNIMIPFSLFAWGETMIDSSLAAIMNGTTPLFTIIVAALVLSDEAITVNRVAGLSLGFAGVLILAGGEPGTSGPAASQLLGVTAIGLASLSYAIAIVWTRRRLGHLRPMVSAFASVGLALPIMAVAALITEPLPDLVGHPEALLATSWLGLLGTGVAYLIYFRLIRHWGATRTSLVTYLLPIVGIVLGVIVLAESVGPAEIGGAGLIIAGVALANSRFGQRRLIGRSPAPASPAPASATVASPAPGSAGPAPTVDPPIT